MQTKLQTNVCFPCLGELEATFKQDFRGVETKTAGLHDHRVTDPVNYFNQLTLRWGDPVKTETAKVIAAIIEVACNADHDEIGAAA